MEILHFKIVKNSSFCEAYMDVFTAVLTLEIAVSPNTITYSTNKKPR